MKKPILWNGVNSNQAVQQGYIGGGFSKQGDWPYEPCKFADGGKFNTGSYMEKLSYMGINKQEGCIEFWNKFLYDSNVSVGLFQWSAQSSGAFQIFLTWQIGCGGGNGFYLYVGGTWSTRTVVYRNSNHIAGDIWHIACCWNLAWASKRARIYINGIDTSALYEGINEDWTPAAYSSGTDFCLGRCDMTGNTYYARSIIENIKIYDYAKTDFSERFRRRGDLNDQIAMVQ